MCLMLIGLLACPHDAPPKLVGLACVLKCSFCLLICVEPVCVCVCESLSGYAASCPYVVEG